ncbi:DUF7522 family protein [Salarchaeum japonicum]|uniref:Uncharacterized protein n=1 Tax=Salarchaeum japonicum TaxID=555573 RepID=A0AAV3T469_9EURY|nr:hypothetical protein [Salarchaeum japonicum]
MELDGTRQSTPGKEALYAVVEEFGGDALRDLWVFDGDTQEPLFVREDVADELADADVERYIDNERYGFVTRETYDNLHYAEFYYTLRGFDTFEQYRTFASRDGERVGVLCSFDRREGGYDFADLTECVSDELADYPLSELLPA